MHDRGRTTPGEPESFSKDRRALLEVKPHEAQDQHASLSSISGALMWIACRTRPDICWVVTRVSRVVRANEQAEY
eukprot:12913916-Prorocentrum_lima.AAC.1